MNVTFKLSNMIKILLFLPFFKAALSYFTKYPLKTFNPLIRITNLKYMNYESSSELDLRPYYRAAQQSSGDNRVPYKNRSNNNHNQNNSSVNHFQLLSSKSNSELASYLKSHASRKTNLTSQEKKHLAQVLKIRIPNLNCNELSSITWSVGTLKLFTRNEDMIIISDLLVDRLNHFRNIITPEDITMSLIGFARFNVKFTPKVPHLFLDSLSRLSKDLDNQQVANVIWSLGKIGVSWQSLSIKSQKALGEAIAKLSTKMAPQGVANTIQGLSNMGITWETLPNYLKSPILDSTKLTINQMKEQEISNCISGLGRLGIDWDVIPYDLQNLLYKNILRISNEFNCKGLAMTIHGLGKMNVKIQNIPKILYKNIEVSFIRLSALLNSQEISNIIYGFGKLGLLLDEEINNEIDGQINIDNDIEKDTILSSQAKDLLYDCLSRESWQLTSQGVANSLWGLKLMNVKWENLPNNLQSSLLQSFNRECINMQEQELGNAIFSLGRLGLPWTELTPQVQNEIIHILEDKIPYMASVGVVMILLGLSRMKLFWNDLSLNTSKIISDGISRILHSANNQTISILLHALASIQAKWELLTPQLQIAIEESIARSHWDLQLSNNYKNTKLIQRNYSKERSAIKKPIEAHILTATKKNNKKSMTGSNNGSAAKSGATPLASKSNISIKSVPIAVTSLTSHHSKQKKLNSLDQFLSMDSSSSSSYHLIYSLGQLGVKWDILGYSTKEVLYSSILTSIESMNEHGVVNLFYGLSNMNLKWIDMRLDIKQILCSNIIRISGDLIEQGLSSLVLSLAKLDVCYTTDLPDQVKQAIRKAISKQAHLGEHSLSSLLYGLGKMSRKWVDLHKDVQKMLKAAIVVCHIDGRITAEGVANSIYGLGLMQANWSQLSSSVKLALLNDIIKVVSTTTTTQFVNILLGLGKMNVCIKSLPVTLVDKLQSHLIELIPLMNEQHVSNLCLGLSSMSLTWFQLSQHTRDLIIQQMTTVTEYSEGSQSAKKSIPNIQQEVKVKESQTNAENLDHSTLHPQGLTMLLVGASRLGLKWAYLPTNLLNNINNLLGQSISQLTTQQLASILSSYSKMTFRWDNFSISLKEKFCNQLSKLNNIRKFTLQDISIIMNSLGTLGMTWDIIFKHGTLRNTVLYWIKNMSLSGNACELAGLVYGLGLMDCSWEKLHEDTRKSLINGITRVTSLTNNSYLYTNKPWTIKYVPTEESTYQLQPQSIANLMYGLSLMVFDLSNDSLINELNSVHISLLDCVSKIGILNFSQNEREQILIYAHFLQTVVSLPQPLLQGHSTPNQLTMYSSSSGMSTSTSRLQESVVKALTNALYNRSDELEVLSEYSAFNGCLPVDASIFLNNKPVAFVEVDGPQHFKGNSLLLRRKDLMKETLYRKKHPHAAFTRVRFDQVNKLGSNNIGNIVADYITSHFHHQPNSDFCIEECNNDMIQQELEFYLDGNINNKNNNKKNKNSKKKSKNNYFLYDDSIHENNEDDWGFKN